MSAAASRPDLPYVDIIKEEAGPLPIEFWSRESVSRALQLAARGVGMRMSRGVGGERKFVIYKPEADRLVRLLHRAAILLEEEEIV